MSVLSKARADIPAKQYRKEATIFHEALEEINKLLRGTGDLSAEPVERAAELLQRLVRHRNGLKKEFLELVSAFDQATRNRFPHKQGTWDETTLSEVLALQSRELEDIARGALVERVVLENAAQFCGEMRDAINSHREW